MWNQEDDQQPKCQCTCGRLKHTDSDDMLHTYQETHQV